VEWLGADVGMDSEWTVRKAVQYVDWSGWGRVVGRDGEGTVKKGGG
jgi:hypothetical protein